MGHGWSMYIMYLSVNREGTFECTSGIFIVNAESLLYTLTVVLRSPLLFQVLWPSVLFPAKFVALRFLFSPDSLQSLNFSSEIHKTNITNPKVWLICMLLIWTDHVHTTKSLKLFACWSWNGSYTCWTCLIWHELHLYCLKAWIGIIAMNVFFFFF